ncbi:MAG: hypothetical protein LBL38_02360 [Lactobacillales bacterium]|jgi:hypothetical protein|nr:hypothetical protein [Lactobacillales bacterium]
MEMRKKFIIGIATIVGAGLLYATSAKAGVAEDAAAFGVTVEEYLTLCNEAARCGFKDANELRAAKAAGFEPTDPTAAQDFRDFLVVRDQPKFHEFLCRTKTFASAQTYKAFKEEQMKLPSAMPADA